MALMDAPITQGDVYVGVGLGLVTAALGTLALTTASRASLFTTTQAAQYLANINAQISWIYGATVNPQTGVAVGLQGQSVPLAQVIQDFAQALAATTTTPFTFAQFAHLWNRLQGDRLASYATDQIAAYVNDWLNDLPDLVVPPTNIAVYQAGTILNFPYAQIFPTG